MFDPIWKLALGLVSGIVFGFLLQKGRVQLEPLRGYGSSRLPQ